MSCHASLYVDTYMTHSLSDSTLLVKSITEKCLVEVINTAVSRKHVLPHDDAMLSCTDLLFHESCNGCAGSSGELGQACGQPMGGQRTYVWPGHKVRARRLKQAIL